MGLGGGTRRGGAEGWREVFVEELEYIYFNILFSVANMVTLD